MYQSMIAGTFRQWYLAPVVPPYGMAANNVVVVLECCCVWWRRGPKRTAGRACFVCPSGVKPLPVSENEKKCPTNNTNLGICWWYGTIPPPHHDTTYDGGTTIATSQASRATPSFWNQSLQLTVIRGSLSLVL